MTMIDDEDPPELGLWLRVNANIHMLALMLYTVWISILMVPDLAERGGGKLERLGMLVFGGLIYLGPSCG